MSTTTTKLNSSDCVEIYCAWLDEALMEKIGPDGSLLAEGKVTLTAQEITDCISAVESKRDRVLEGFYDWKPGEVNNPKSESAKWAKHLTVIMTKLKAMQAACAGDPAAAQIAN